MKAGTVGIEGPRCARVGGEEAAEERVKADVRWTNMLTAVVALRVAKAEYIRCAAAAGEAVTNLVESTDKCANWCMVGYV